MPKPTTIEKIETYLWDRWLIVRVICEDGTIGIGEGGVHGWQFPTEAMIKTITPYLIGKDPSIIEHHYQYLYRNSHFMGSIINGALSAIDIALWDIKGKRLGVPIYDLMGGKTRNKARCYIHVEGETIDELVSDSLEKVKEGFTAIRFQPYSSNFFTYDSVSEWIDDAENRVSAVRESIGNKIDLCIEIHRQMSPSESIMLGKRLEKFNPFFYEDPMLPDSPEIMKDIQEKSNLPIATGERLLSRWEFREILEANSVSIIQPDVAHCGGISELRRIASMAEVYYVHTAPHCAIGPVAFSSCLQVDACTPNFFIQEQVDAGLGNGLLHSDWVVKDGYIDVPQKHGLGIEIDEDAACRVLEFDEPELGGDDWFYEDGSVADW